VNSAVTTEDALKSMRSGGNQTGAREHDPALGYRPLYKQVRDMLVRRLAEGTWQPGQVIPSEFQLAEELGVSQGTIRKALDSMTTERLLVRQQGRGTFVAEHSDEHILFHFFRLIPDRGAPAFPTSRFISVKEGIAGPDERKNLGLDKKAKVIRIRRLRFLSDGPAILEGIAVSGTKFSGLARRELPNNLYALYSSEYGVTIGQAREKLKAVALDSKQGSLLEVPAGTPALQIDRLAHDLENRPVEWRLSFCLTEAIHYLSNLK
jgi:GntR family transcriptional regulator